MKRMILSTLFLVTVLLTSSILLLSFETSSYAKAPAAGPTLNPKTIPKFVNQLVIPPVFVPTNVLDSSGNVIRQDYAIDVTQFYEQILPTTDALGNPTSFGPTKVWGYGGNIMVGGIPTYFRNAPAATFEATRGIPVQVKWINNLVDGSGNPLSHMFPVDPTLHWADPNEMNMPGTPFPAYPPGFSQAQTPVPITTHLHGGEVQSTSDGGPDSWFTPDGIQGPGYSSIDSSDTNAATYYYPNAQPATTLWYHDHALGITRINVMSGLAGFYLLRDPTDTIAPLLPQGQYEVPLAIQDRSFNLDGSLWFPTAGINPTMHPYWMPEFFGNTIMVNGKVWPNMNVQPQQYRFRVLDGSNARFYTLSLQNKLTGTFIPFTVIGGDGGYLPAPAKLTSLTIAPGERADILVDFSTLPAGSKILMKNDAKAPFPGGAPADPQTVGQVMQFTVSAGTPVTPPALPATLITMPTLTPNAPSRLLTLIEVMGPAGPAEILLDGQKWDAPTTETPQVGSTEDWVIVNPTADTHPIHLHLVQFQLISRQKFQVNNYMTDWTALNGMAPLTQPTVNVASITPYLSNNPKPPLPNEMGWKDTIQVNPGEVTIIRVRFAPQDAPTTGPSAPTPGTNLFPFDPTVGPGYVWHCHIIDHEDNEMMRRMIVVF